MDDEALDPAKRESFALAQYAANEVKAYGITRTFGQAVSIALQAALKFPAPRRLASSLMDSRLSVSLVEDQLKTSGQVTNSDLIVIVSSHERTPRKGRGKSGYFIYPPLRKIQPELVKKWEEAFSKILKEWDK